MSDTWVTVTVLAVAAAAAAVYLLALRPRPVVFANAREERLTHQLARVVGCSLEEALPSIRQEIGYAPGQSDETLLKRAAYHYRQNMPQRPGLVYHDEVPGHDEVLG